MTFESVQITANLRRWSVMPESRRDGWSPAGRDFVFWSLATRTLCSGWIVYRLGHWVTHPGPWRDSRPLWFLLLRSTGGILLLVRPSSEFRVYDKNQWRTTVVSGQCGRSCCFWWLFMTMTFPILDLSPECMQLSRIAKKLYRVGCSTWGPEAVWPQDWTGSFDPDNL